MSTTPTSTVLEFEALIKVLPDPETKIMYHPSSGLCQIHVRSEEGGPHCKQLSVPLFLFEKIRQLHYLRKVAEEETHHEYRVTDDIFILEEIKYLCSEGERVEKERKERIAKLRDRSQEG